MPDSADETARLRRQARADAARINILSDIVNRYVTLAEETEETNRLIRAYLQQAPMQSAITEPLEGLDERLEIIERQITRLVDIARIIVFKQGAADQALSMLDRVERQGQLPGLRRRLEIEVGNLQKLLERKAEFAGEAPVHLLNQIERVEGEIEVLETQIRELE